MSLEVTLIPLAFIVINVLDKSYYDSWIKNKRIKKKTGYDSLDEFLNDLNQTDYAYDIQQGTVRICSGKQGERFYFSQLRGHWVFSFSEYDSKEDVARFLKAISAVSDGKVTSEVPQFSARRRAVANIPAVNQMPSLSDREVHFYPTIYSDEELLCNALKKFDIDYTIHEDGISYVKDGVECTFLKDEKGKYILRIIGNVSEEDLYRNIQELDLVYRKNVQKKAYDSVIEKMESHNMSLANEVRLEDDTIVLTLNVE